jgi:hypothetical protein
MSGLYYLVFCVAILVIIWWCWDNDKGSEQDGYKGVLAIRAPKQKEPESEVSRRRT